MDQILPFLIGPNRIEGELTLGGVSEGNLTIFRCQEQVIVLIGLRWRRDG